jgi:integrase
VPSLLYDRKPDGSVRARLRINGKLTDLGRFANDELAHEAIERARENNVLGKASVTVKAWAANWQALYPGQRNERSDRHYRQMCGQFAREHGSLPLADVTPLMAQRWAVEHPSQVKFLRRMFGKAVKAGLLSVNVWESVEVPQVGSPRLPPTPAQLERLVDAARARGGWWVHFADCMVFVAYSGLRGEEMERVQAQDVLEAGRRVVVYGKRRSGEVAPRVRTVAVFEPGRQALLRQAPDLGRVWRAQRGGSLTQGVREGAYRQLVAEARMAGTFHGLRKFCATWLLDHGASDLDVAVQLGHIDSAGHADAGLVRSTYGHPTVEPALQRLEAVTDKGVPDGGVADGVRDPGADGGAAHGGAA